MMAWQRDLDLATSASEIVQLTRGYLAEMSPEQLAQLPPDCRPASIAEPQDVRAWSERLNEAYWKVRAGTGSTAAIQELWAFFLRASTRLARLAEERTVS